MKRTPAQHLEQIDDLSLLLSQTRSIMTLLIENGDQQDFSVSHEITISAMGAVDRLLHIGQQVIEGGSGDELMSAALSAGVSHE